MKRIYKVAKSGGDNLGGPALTWFIILGPGVGRTHYPRRREADDVARMMNLAWAESKKPERICGICHRNPSGPRRGEMCLKCSADGRHP